MSQIFHRSANALSRITLALLLFLLILSLLLIYWINRSDFVTQRNVVRGQPIPFSHQHHVSGIGIDCRYCHHTVETGPFAGIPSAQTCMNCHSEIWAESPMLEGVRISFRTGKPIQWVRVNDLPDIVQFDHSIHVKKGIGCESCHGRVDRMPLLRQAVSLQMKWCLDCHRHPEPYRRPREAVFKMGWQPLEAEVKTGEGALARRVTDCSTCHF